MVLSRRPYRPSPRARASASNRRGTRWYWTERLSRQALWPRAQAIQLLPSPVAPVMSRFSLRSIQSPPASLAKTARSIPRGVRKSTSSTHALAQRGELEAGRETLGVALGGFAIDQQSDALLE